MKLLILLFSAAACTKSSEKSNNVNLKINSCIDQKLNEGWKRQRAESFCDNHY